MICNKIGSIKSKIHKKSAEILQSWQKDSNFAAQQVGYRPQEGGRMPSKRNTGEMPGQSRCGDFVSFHAIGSAPPETVSHWKLSFWEGRPE